MRASIHNRQGELPADHWYQIEVTGEHPAGQGRRQVIDEIALQSICNRFRQDAGQPDFAGLLVDNDHLSHDMSQSTQAYAWARELDIRDGQLHARLDLTDIGETAIRNKRFKFFSTEYDPEHLEDLGGGRVRPLCLAGLAFTNRPNNRGAKPISNRETTNNQNQQNDMQTIAAKLGLPPEATEAEILAAIDALIQERDTAAGKEAETAAEAIMNRFANRIPEDKRADVKKRLIANRADTEAMLSLLPEPQAAPTRVFNRATAATPAAVSDGKDEAARGAEVMKAVQAIRNRDATTFERAWETARAEKPELFC